AADAAGDADAIDADALAQLADHLFGRRARVVDERSTSALPEGGDRPQDVLFRLRLDLRQLLQTVRFRGLLELIDRGDAELLVDRPRRGGADAVDTQQCDEPGRDRGLQLDVPLR